MKINRATILVAGRARRLGHLTEGMPKCLLEVGGRSILDRGLSALADCGVEDAVLIVGYRANQIRDRFGSRYGAMRLSYVENTRYAETNTAYSLYLARETLSRGGFLIEGDILFGQRTLESVEQCAERTGSAWAALPIRPGLDEGILIDEGVDGMVETVELVRDLSKRRAEFSHKCGGIQYLSRDLAESFVGGLVEATDQQKIFADLILARSVDVHPMALCSIEGLPWAEVDTADDLDLARDVFEIAGNPTASSGSTIPF